MFNSPGCCFNQEWSHDNRECSHRPPADLSPPHGCRAVRRGSSPAIGGDTKVIAFRRAAGAQRAAPGLQDSDMSGISNIIRFQPRGPAPRRWETAADRDIRSAAIQDDDDYRQRMVVNVLVAVVLALLITGADWLVEALAKVP